MMDGEGENKREREREQRGGRVSWRVEGGRRGREEGSGEEPKRARKKNC